MLDPLRRGVAEFIGTFTLIFIGAAAMWPLPAYTIRRSPASHWHTAWRSP